MIVMLDGDGRWNEVGVAKQYVESLGWKDIVTGINSLVEIVRAIWHKGKTSPVRRD